MNKIVNKFLLAGDNFMSKFHLRQPGFTYRACGPVTKHHDANHKKKETGDLEHIYKNELDKASFVHHAAHSDSKGLAKKLFEIKF